MIPPKDFLERVIRPTLRHLAEADPRLGGRAAEQLMLGTAIAESGLDALVQMGGGPALSFFQIEPATFGDIYGRYLLKPARADLKNAIDALLVPAFGPLEQLDGNPYFACAVARTRYWWVKARLPAAGDIKAMGRYWKANYNTARGAGDAAHFAHLYRQLVGDLL